MFPKDFWSFEVFHQDCWIKANSGIYTNYENSLVLDKTSALVWPIAPLLLLVDLHFTKASHKQLIKILNHNCGDSMLCIIRFILNHQRTISDLTGPGLGTTVARIGFSWKDIRMKTFQSWKMRKCCSWFLLCSKKQCLLLVINK